MNYSVVEMELDSIERSSTDLMIIGSVSQFSLGISAACAIEWFVNRNQGASTCFWLFAVVGVICGLLSFRVWYSRKTVIDKIKEQAKKR